MSNVFLSSKFLGLTPKYPECTYNINVIQKEQQVWDCSHTKQIPSSATQLQCNFGQVTFLNSSLFNFKTRLAILQQTLLMPCSRAPQLSATRGAMLTPSQLPTSACLYFLPCPWASSGAQGLAKPRSTRDISTRLLKCRGSYYEALEAERGGKR